MDPQLILKTFISILITDFLRYFIPASIAFTVVWLMLGKQLRQRFIHARKPNNRRLWFEFKYSMSTILIFALVGLGVITAKNYGAFFIYQDMDQYGWLYFTFSVIVMLLFHDFYFYWTHRFMHHPKIFKHVHKVHHMSTSPSPWAAYSFHPLEAIIQAMVFPIILLFLPVHKLAILTFLTYMIVRNVWGHLGYELLPKNFLKMKLLNWHTTTTHHNMHHQSSQSNYGLYFTWWDKLMRTEHERYRETYEKNTTSVKHKLEEMITSHSTK